MQNYPYDRLQFYHKMEILCHFLQMTDLGTVSQKDLEAKFILEPQDPMALTMNLALSLKMPLGNWAQFMSVEMCPAPVQVQKCLTWTYIRQYTGLNIKQHTCTKYIKGGVLIKDRVPPLHDVLFIMIEKVQLILDQHSYTELLCEYRHRYPIFF